MTALIAWGGATLVASAALMLLVVAIRAPVRHWFGPRLGYALWVLPALRLILPPLPLDVFGRLPLAADVGTGMSVLFVGPRSAPDTSIGLQMASTLPVIWLVGAVALFSIYALRHFLFCRGLRAVGSEFGRVGGIRILATDVDGPLAFGVLRRFIAVPRGFARDYQPRERDLALAHEAAHHARGDLIANWGLLLVLAAHWWNPVAWLAIRAFRDDQEYATDAHVLAGKESGVQALYVQTLAKAAGIGALPACNLNAPSNLKGRLMMIRQTPRSTRQLVLGGVVLTLLGGTALAATVAAPDAATGSQVVTIGVKPDGAGGHALLIGATTVASGAPLPGGATLPADFTAAGGCSLKPNVKPSAMVIKGEGATQTYTVMCASAAPASVRVSLAEGLASLRAMRASVATQPASQAFPEAERSHALGAIDRSIREVEATLKATA